ncbi:YbaK/EbsC family protein [Nocardiopsis akebiae]|uniref:YbaK/EbsC family protein n=1 Tax=Nocardiopsis akebiae TaxID=2831968 RepID=A0ABX8C423_9ACTN|nr:YbaK/EbsC family protein [Nocardiopsis akebiae]QUX29149.1 YbaK/EbsC family protein [Nocardiopsis akebiae]
MSGGLNWVRADEHPELLADPVLAAVRGREDARVAPIDPELADTAQFCERYGMPLATSANCVVVAARRGGEVSYAACMVPATQRADVNGIVRRRLGARKISFAPMDEATGLTGMEYGGITPLGLPEGWPVLVDEAVAAEAEVVVGSGVRRSKLLVPGKLLADLPGAEVLALTR